MDVEIELDRQVVQPGDKVEGWLTVNVDDVESVTVSFQGEEILGANDILQTFTLSVADEKLVLDLKEGTERRPFCFTVPDDAPPTYASRNIRCQYFVKAHVKRTGFWRRSMLSRLHVTVLPAVNEELSALPEVLEIEDELFRLIARLDRKVLLTGESLTGTLLLEAKEETMKLPNRVSFRLAAIEESTNPAFQHREVLTLDSHEVEIRSEDFDEMLLPLRGDFEFPLHQAAEPSGTWNTFKVHYGFRASLYDDGKNERKSTEIRVLRDLRVDAPSESSEAAADSPDSSTDVVEAPPEEATSPQED